MEKILELRRKRGELVEQCRALLDKAEEEKRGLTDEENTRYEALIKEIEKTKQDEEKEVKLGGFEEEARHFEPNKPNPNEPSPSSENRAWGSLGEQLMAVIEASRSGGKVDERLTRAASGLGEAVPSEGGFLVQQDFATELLKKTYETGVLANRCRKLPISANANSIKLFGIDETSRVDGSRWGGVRAYWADEAAEKTASKPKFRKMELNLNKLIGLCYATDELLQDAAALESVIMQAFSEEFGFKLDDAIINGDGSGKPLGVLNAGCLVSVAKETGQAAATVETENIVKIWARMWAKSRANAVWFINQDIEPQLFTMTLAVGTGGVPVYMPANGLSDSPYGKLMGRLVIPIEQCATLGTVGDIILADFSQYILADKGSMQAAQSIHVRFVYDESVFRFVYRVDGQPIWNSALTPYKGSNTLSPFVALATRS